MAEIVHAVKRPDLVKSRHSLVNPEIPQQKITGRTSLAEIPKRVSLTAVIEKYDFEYF